MTFYPETKHWETLAVKIAQEFPFHIFTTSIKTSYPKHRHNFLEMSLVIDGEGYEIINGIEHPIKAGTCALLLPYQVHEIHAAPQRPISLYNCMFDLSFLMQPSVFTEGLKKLMYSQENLPSFVQLGDEQLHAFTALMDDLIAEAQSTHYWRNDLIQAKLTELLIRFDRLRREKNPAIARQSAENRKSIWPVIHYIHTHFNEPLSLSQLSDLFKIDISHLSKEFKKQMGLNFVHFLHEVRVLHACSLLVSTKMSGIDIALEAGFGSKSSFSRIFTSVKGMTPGEYRRIYSEA